MENASKAMLMAASVLIGIMIVSVMIYIFSLFGDFSANQEREREEQQREAFNGRFLKYDGLGLNGTDGVTVHDIVTIINLAAQNNRDQGFVDTSGNIATQPANDYEYYIQVEIKNYVSDANTSIGTNSDAWSEVAIQEFIENNTLETGTSNLKTFTCEVTIGADTKYVKKVIFDGTP